MNFKSSLFLIVASICALVANDVANAQPARGQGAAGGRGFRGMNSNESLNLLRNPSVQEELELVDDQVEELTNLQDEMIQEMRNSWQGYRDLDETERQTFFDEMRAKMEVRSKELNEQVKGILLPHQQSRLQQLVIQTQARRFRGGVTGVQASGALNSDKIKEALKITEEQEQEIKTKAEKVKKELDEKINKLRAEAEKEILGVLTSEQRTKYKELVGDAFDFGGFARGGGRGGERGGRGGRDRGGRGRGGDEGRPRSDF